MKKGEYKGISKYQPSASNREIRRASESPKKRGETGWISTGAKQGGQSLSLQSMTSGPKRHGLPSPASKNARTVEWVQQTVKQTSDLTRKRRARPRGSSDEDSENFAECETERQARNSDGSHRTEQTEASTEKISEERPRLLLPRPRGLDEAQENWVYWRICNGEIRPILEKHRSKFQNRYLSSQILKDIFCPESLKDLMQRGQSVALEVTENPTLFLYGDRGKRLTVTGKLFQTDNVEMKSNDDVVVAANGTLSQFLEKVIRSGDLITVFHQDGPQMSNLVVLNARFLRTTVHIVHYRVQDENAVEDYESICGNRLKVDINHCDGKKKTISVRPVKLTNFSAVLDKKQAEQMEIAEPENEVEEDQAGDLVRDNDCNITTDKDVLSKQPEVSQKSADSSRTTFTPASQKSAGGSSGSARFPPDAFEQTFTPFSPTEASDNAQQAATVTSSALVAMDASPADAAVNKPREDVRNEIAPDHGKDSSVAVRQTTEQNVLPDVGEIIEHNPTSREADGVNTENHSVCPMVAVRDPPASQPEIDTQALCRDLRYTQSETQAIRNDLDVESQLNEMVESMLQKDSHSSSKDENLIPSTLDKQSAKNVEDSSHPCASAAATVEENVVELQLETQSFPLDSFDFNSQEIDGRNSENVNDRCFPSREDAAEKKSAISGNYRTRNVVSTKSPINVTRVLTIARK